MLTAALVAGMAAAMAAEPPRLTPAPEQGVVLLRNGQVIEGKITWVGELCYVTLPQGEIRLRAAEVELCCRDLEEGYRRKRAAVRHGDVHGHLRLAQWCLRHDLLGHAATELADAIDADATHPMIDLLRRRLELAMRPPTKPPASPQPADPSPSFEELDQLVRSLPSGSVQTFTETIQPMLMNNCTAGGCHGPQTTTEFRLHRIPKGRPPTRRVTQQNLHAVLQWIDRERPAASRLLSVADEPHGAAGTPVFTEHRRSQYQRLVDWAYQAAGRREPEAPATVAAAGRSPVQAMTAQQQPQDDKATKTATPGLLSAASGARPMPSTDPRNPFGASGSRVAPAAYQQPVPPSATLVPGANGSTVKRGAQLKQFVPADPFDPEIFNRRYFGEKTR